MVILGSPMVLFAEFLGASSDHIGLLYSAVFFFLPVQILSTTLLPLLGYKRQLMLAWGARSLFIFAHLFIALSISGEPEAWMLPVFIFSTLAFCFIRSIGATAVLPWLYDILPDRIRGRYFALDSLVIGCAGVLTLLFSSAVFALLSVRLAFALLFFITICAAGLSLYFVKALPQSDRKPAVIPLRKLAQRTPQLCFRPSHFRRFLKLQTLYAVAGYAFVPFTTFYLKSSLGYSQSYILGLTALQFIGMTCAAWLIKNWVDQLGPKPFFVISNIVTIGYQIFWIGLLQYPQQFEPLLPLVYFAVGVAMANYLTATNKYIPQICRKKEMALSVTLLSAFVGLLGGLASTTWGYFLKNPQSGQISDIAFAIYFLIALTLQLYLVRAYMRIKDTPTDSSALPNSGFLVRPFRYLVTMINLVEPSKGRKLNHRPPKL